MALVIATNSYGDVAGADAYFADNLRTAEWTGVLAGTRPQALVTASLNISIVVLAKFKLGTIVAPIPELLERAAFELALDMALDAALITTPGSDASNIKEVGAGPGIGVKFFRDTDARALSTRIFRILKSGEFLAANVDSSTLIGSSSSFGLDDCSSFDTRSARTKGLS